MEEEIRTKKLVIVDNDGNPKIELRTISNGDPQIILRDKKGVPAIRISIDDNERPIIQLVDADDIFVEGELENGMVTSMNILSLSKEGNGMMSLSIHNAFYGSRVMLGVDKNNRSVLLLSDKHNNLKSVVTSGEEKEYGDMHIYTHDDSGQSGYNFKELIDWAKRQNG
ncbi:MAG TPA: hypothetical protein VFC92_03330 [Bacteroidales bacterium]|nr:hypothetical protein [Bacteroidales bacterium]